MRLRFDSVPSGVDNDFRVPPEIICAQNTIELSRALTRLDKPRRDGF